MSPAASPDPSTDTPPGFLTRVDSLAPYVLVGIYCALQLSLAIAHDPWVDEAQAWLWATTLSRPIDFFILPGEGHPPLWYWLLRALSGVLDFNQARYVVLPIVFLNAFLLMVLLRGQFLLLAMMLLSFSILHFWGYHFRPYSIVLLLTLGALLLDRHGRPLAATWALAVACGFHFFAGFLFAFWLVWQLKKGTPLRTLLAPALLAAVFGALAVLSGLGNAGLVPPPGGLLAATLSNLAWSAMLPEWRHPVVALLTLGVLGFGLRKEPLLLATLLVLLLVFSLATAAVYGRYPWHFAFMTMLCFMAFTLTAPRSAAWVMPLLLVVPMIQGISSAELRLTTPVWSEPDLYQLIRTDAGPGFDPARQLVAWPDIVGLATAAVEDITLIGGNNGALLGPVDWRQSAMTRIDPGLLVLPRPYWIICAQCTFLLERLEAGGLTTSALGDKFNPDNGQIFAYRVD